MLRKKTAAGREPLPAHQKVAHQKVAQPKPALPNVAPPKSPPAAPPVYRPQPTPVVLQKKSAVPTAPTAQRPGQPRTAPAPPPVYRPQPAPRCLQLKAAPGAAPPAARAATQGAARRPPFAATAARPPAAAGRAAGVVQPKLYTVYPQKLDSDKEDESLLQQSFKVLAYGQAWAISQMRPEIEQDATGTDKDAADAKRLLVAIDRAQAELDELDQFYGVKIQGERLLKVWLAYRKKKEDDKHLASFKDDSSSDNSDDDDGAWDDDPTPSKPKTPTKVTPPPILYEEEELETNYTHTKLPRLTFVIDGASERHFATGRVGAAFTGLIFFPAYTPDTDVAATVYLYPTATPGQYETRQHFSDVKTIHHEVDKSPSHEKLRDLVLSTSGSHDTLRRSDTVGFTVIKGRTSGEHRFSFTSNSQNHRLFNLRTDVKERKGQVTVDWAKKIEAAVRGITLDANITPTTSDSQYRELVRLREQSRSSVGGGSSSNNNNNNNNGGSV